MNQFIKIIGGIWRGKKIPVLDSPHLRPTPNRVRETLFNWLMHDVRNARCLDAFAGSGALGFEAFSRGASAVDFVEAIPTVCSSLKKVVNACSSPHLHVYQADTLAFLKTITNPYDIIFLDPPFHHSLLPACMEELELGSCLKKEGLLYVEAEENICLNKERWMQLKQKKAGAVYYGLYQKKDCNPISD